MNEYKSSAWYPVIIESFARHWQVLLMGVPIFTILTFGVTEAHADNVWDAIGISCLADFNYLSIETMALPLSRSSGAMMNSKSKISDITKRLESEHNIYTPLSLLNHPFHCKLQGHSISIAIEDYVAPHANGECGLLETLDISVRIDGTSSHRFPAYGVNRCTAPEHHFVTVDYLGTLMDCTIPEWSEPPRKAVCDTYKLEHPDGQSSSLKQNGD